MSTHLVILGPPGAGKGTQAARIAAHLGIVAISTGDIFRAHLRDRTPLGLEVRAIVDAGEYVPDELTNAIVRGRLAQPDTAPGFLLDGYPRTPGQVTELDAMLAFEDRTLDAVIELVADTDALVDRLQRRAQTEGRTDDTEDVIRHRQDVYNEQTAPLLAVYADRGLLVEVDGMGVVDEVSERIFAALEKVRGSAAS